ncbi:hypothetical protein C1645_833453 [Glomus cerebriforme]|uniref:Uncharacterized protein n=1 Tax=Glomus cerebriforme TaxID=658196 RepID=A0A397SG38_9GLOM|nr:hypothetical protein C1645_833453 [Glomus cerebriforme]
MSKKQTTHTHKFLRSDARCLSPEAIEEIRNAQNNIPDAQRIMLPEPTEEWCRIIESVSISDQISENNQKSSHDTSFSTNIQEDGIIHTEHHADDENGPNSHINSNNLNTVTNGWKDKVSQKKKASIKPKDESSSFVALVEKNENQDNTSRWESDLKKLINITRESSGAGRSSHSGVMFAQFTSSLFLSLCIVTGIIKSLPLWESSTHPLNPGAKVISILWMTPIDSTSTVAMPLRSCFMNISMTAPMCNTISSVMIAITELESSTIAGIRPSIDSSSKS